MDSQYCEEPRTCYKWTSQFYKTYGETLWIPGVWKKIVPIDCTRPLCTEAWFYAFCSEGEAHNLKWYYADNYQVLWEAEVRGNIIVDKIIGATECRINKIIYQEDEDE